MINPWRHTFSIINVNDHPTIFYFPIGQNHYSHNAPYHFYLKKKIKSSFIYGGSECVMLFVAVTNENINLYGKFVFYIFMCLSLRQDVLWYTNVRLSVRSFHMSRSNLRTPWPIHFKFHRVIGIDDLTLW